VGELNYEARFALRDRGLGILDDLEFKYAPVGMKFFNVESDLEGLGLERLESRMAWCQMLVEAQKGKAFYATAQNQSCEPGIFLTGHGELAPIAASGRIGPAFDIYPDERANRRIYNHITCLAAGSTFATGFAPYDMLTFDPDVLIIVCDNMVQGERMMRATQWDTGDMIVSRMTYVMGCNWMFTYPFTSGEINVVWTGVCHGMTGHELYPTGLPIVCVPWNQIDRVMRNLREMPRILPSHTAEREECERRGCERLGVDGII
jgi:uncharacterized protein (DUF169 family)